MVAVRAHAAPDRPPFTLRPGDVVAVGERDDEWPAFVFVTTEHGAGSAPSRVLTNREGRTEATRAYDTTELPTEVGDELEVLRGDDQGGWLWCRNPDGAEGWVPLNTVEAMEGL